MSKKKKLKLDDLKVNSFVTSLADEMKQVKGGTVLSFISYCSDCYCPSDTDCSYCATCSCTCDTCDCGGGGGNEPILIQF
jgi:hypothetical protein